MRAAVDSKRRRRRLPATYLCGNDELWHLVMRWSRNPHWRGDGKELFYYSPTIKGLMAVTVEEKGQELTLGTPHALFSVPLGLGSTLGTLFDVMPDGRRFLFSGLYASPGDVPLSLVTNWDAELAKK